MRKSLNILLIGAILLVLTTAYESNVLNDMTYLLSSVTCLLGMVYA